MSQLRMRGITDEAVLQAMARVPRHLFVPRETLEDAYADQPLPISMLLDLTKESRVLEIGTGCGYQTAILAELAGEVYSVEIVEGLYRQAKARLAELGYARVQLRLGDGYYGWAEHAPYDAILATCAPEQDYGWAEHAPYDAILATCAPEQVPPPLSAQLRDGGRLVIPVGSQGDYQVLYLLRRQGDKVTTQRIFEVAFVPLTGPHDQDPDAADD